MTEGRSLRSMPGQRSTRWRAENAGAELGKDRSDLRHPSGAGMRVASIKMRLLLCERVNNRLETSGETP